jgi:hypothetical protein
MQAVEEEEGGGVPGGEEAEEAVARGERNGHRED